MSTYRNKAGVQATTTPFLYIVGWPDLHKFYIGVRFRKGCHPSDMWTRYFTSSKYVHALADQHGKPPYIDIIQTYENADEAKEAEFNILRDNGALKKEWFINLRAGNAIRMTPEVREKVGQKSAERWRDPGYRARQIAKRVRVKSDEELEAERLISVEKRKLAREGRSAALKRQHADPEMKARRMSGWHSEESRKKNQASRQLNPREMTEEGRKSVSEKAKARWANPEFRAKMLGHVTNLHLTRKGPCSS